MRKYCLVWPPGPDRTEAIDLLVGEGFSRRNITTLPPTFPRPQIEQTYRRILATPYDQLVPNALLPPKAAP